MTTIGPSLSINGQITSKEDVTIHGQVAGTISMEQGALLISPTADVKADAEVTRVTIHGKFAGDIAATERVELSKTANVQGTLLAPAVVLQDGAVFNGSIEVSRRPKTTANASTAA
jgi:cytoskeletal protein CcmA (bactofilin family)